MLHVVSALIKDPSPGGKIFLQRRSKHKEYGGLFETPGGKREPGETIQSALKRELWEELGLEKSIVNPSPILLATFHPPLCRESHSIGIYEVMYYGDKVNYQGREDATDLGFYDIWKLVDEECTPSLNLYRSYVEIANGYRF